VYGGRSLGEQGGGEEDESAALQVVWHRQNSFLLGQFVAGSL
jgi:hypothetical protein